MALACAWLGPSCLSWSVVRRFCCIRPIDARLTARKETAKSVRVGRYVLLTPGRRRGGQDGPLARQSFGPVRIARSGWAGGRARRPEVHCPAGAPCRGAWPANVTRPSSRIAVGGHAGRAGPWQFASAAGRYATPCAVFGSRREFDRVLGADG